MSCYPEVTYAIYVDGELPLDELRPVEAHLVTCRNCRELVMSLRDEAAMLTNALFERVPRSAGLESNASPARGLALGTLPAVFGVAAAASLVGWAAETFVPSAFDWLNPFRITGAYDMVFNVIFWIERVPGLLQFLLAASAVVSFAGLLSYAISALARQWVGGSAMLAALLLASLPTPSHALDLRSEDNVSVAAGDTLEDTLVIYAETVQINGRVAGDLFVVANRLTIPGEVEGNVFAVVRNFDLSGAVDGSVHAFGDRVEVTGKVGGNIYSVCESYTLTEGGEIGRDATHFGEGTSVAGKIGRDLFTGGEWLELRGDVKRDIEARADRIALLDGARVGGDVDAELWSRSEIEVAPGAIVEGETRSARPQPYRPSRMERYLEGHFYVWLAIELAAGFLLGLLLHALVPSLFDVRLETGADFARAMGIGFVTLVATPIALVLAAITLVGIPIAILGGALYLAAIYCSLILIGALVGNALMEARDVEVSFAASLLVGLAVLIFALNLPFVGGVARILAVLVGLGLLTERAREAWRQRRLPA